MFSSGSTFAIFIVISLFLFGAGGALVGPAKSTNVLITLNSRLQVT